MTHCFPAQVSHLKQTPISEMMEEEIKRWTVHRKSELVLEIIQGKASVAAVSRQFCLTRSRDPELG